MNDKNCNSMYSCKSECPRGIICPLDRGDRFIVEKNRSNSRYRHHAQTKERETAIFRNSYRVAQKAVKKKKEEREERREERRKERREKRKQ